MASLWAAAEPAAKRRMVSRMMSLRGISAHNLRRVLDVLEPDHCLTRKAVRQAVDRNDVLQVSIVKLPLVDGGDFEWPVALPQTRLHVAARTAGIRDVFADALRTAGVREKWRLIVYLDEITPGNPLRPDNKRKINAFYVSCLELAAALCSESAWFFVGCLRSTIAKQVRGGISGVTRALLRAFFVGTMSLSIGGVLLPDGALLFVKMHRLLCDEGAGKVAWCVKGAAGIKNCMHCKNVVILSDAGEGLTDFDDQDYLVDITCSDVRRWHMCLVASGSKEKSCTSASWPAIGRDSLRRRPCERRRLDGLLVFISRTREIKTRRPSSPRPSCGLCRSELRPMVGHEADA